MVKSALMDYALPPLFAIAIWWLGTGVVMLLDGMPRSTFRWSLGISTAIALAALVCIARSAQQHQRGRRVCRVHVRGAGLGLA